MTNALLQWELDWVMENVDLYHGEWHAKAVCGNITKRYFIVAAQRLSAEYQREPTEENLNKLLAHLAEYP